MDKPFFVIHNREEAQREIAQKIWERRGQPKNKDLEIWVEAGKSLRGLYGIPIYRFEVVP